MKNKKIIILIVVIIIIIGIIFFTQKQSKNVETVSNAETEINYNESDGMYEIRNSNNEVVANAIDKATLQIYIDDPEYNP